jgi:hyperpolarization activated cyclic nucleotide-gated potassium channel 1
VIYTVIIVPYRISFVDKQNAYWDNFETFIDTVFIFDVIVNCFTAVYIKEELVVRYNEILKNYAKGWMTLDVLSAIPLNIIITGSEWGTLTKLIKFPRLYRMLKITKILKTSSIAQAIYSIECLEFLTHLSLQTKRLIYFFMSFSILCHLLTCLWFFMSTLNPELNWVLKYDFSDKSTLEQYLASLYWVVTTLATVGYGDITASNSTERAMCIFVMLLGVFFYSYTVGTISTIMSELDREQEKIDGKMHILQDIQREFKLKKALLKRIINSFKLNRSSTTEDYSDLLKSLPRRLALQLNFCVNKKLVEKSNKFFRNKPIAFITIVLEYLKSIKLSAKEVIFSKGDVSNEIYFISKGEISIFDEYFKNEINFEVLMEGEFFGEVGVMLCERRLYFAKTNRVTELMILDKDVLFDALRPFPDLMKEMEDEAVKRKKHYKDKIERYSKEFIINRNLGKTVAVNKNHDEEEADNKAENIRFFNSVKNTLSQKAVELVEEQKPLTETLLKELNDLEACILMFQEKVAAVEEEKRIN